MKKQTAVEYLFQQLWDTPKDKLTWYAILKQSKAMEKDQIKDAWLSAWKDSMLNLWKRIIRKHIQYQSMKMVLKQNGQLMVLLVMKNILSY